MSFKLKTLTLGLPFDLGQATIEVGEVQKVAAWKLYVEMSTRVSTQPMTHGSGSLREVLRSLYQLFDVTRTVLKEAGPDIGQSPDDLGPIAIRILNDGLRPFLTKWHAAYGNHETMETFRLIREHNLRSIPLDLIDQANWESVDAFYQELELTRKALQDYVEMLGVICGAVPPSQKSNSE